MTGKINFRSDKPEITIPGEIDNLAEKYIKDLHNSGRKQLSAANFSDINGEKWKYSNLKKRINREFIITSAENIEYSALENSFTKYKDGVQIVLVNGIFSSELSNLKNLSSGLTVNCREFNPRKRENPGILGSVASIEKNSFLSLNTSLFEDYIIISTVPGSKTREPVYITVINSSKNESTIHFPRIFIKAGDDSELNIVEEHVGLNNSIYMSNPVTEISMGKGSKINYYKLQKESSSAFHIGILAVTQDEGSSFNSFLSSFGGKLVRNEIYASVKGHSAESYLQGVYMLNDSQHIDNHTEIFHMSPGSSSSEKYHGILNGNASAVFDGLIYVAKGADLTDSTQSNKTLLLSDKATVDSKPALEIYAEDVKCSHSATVGQMDEESVYYLRSRGISKKDSVNILTAGFADEIIDKIGIESIRKQSSELLSTKLAEMNDE